jgi:hypothetical protein
MASRRDPAEISTPLAAIGDIRIRIAVKNRAITIAVPP